MLIPGTRVGDYVVERALGSGAVSVVYRVVHEESGRRYALKVLRLLRDDVERRFLREARIQASLVHPGIVPVRDILQVGDAPGLLQELVEGPLLDRWIAEARPAVEDGLGVFRALLSAVSHAHNLQVVHRDLKPRNVLMHWSHGAWRPRITDFGIAKLLGEAGEDTVATSVGVVLGTPGYMAPEQYTDAGQADERSDVFALGAILYELLTGVPVFPQSTLEGRQDAAMAGEYTKPDALVPDLPPAVVETIKRCLSPRPEDRLASCAALGKALPRPPRSLPISEQPTELSRLHEEPATTRSHVPVALDAFVGRQSELAHLGRWAEGASRVLTILGTGGMGKTRLALRFAEDARWRYPGGVWFVDLTSAKDQASILRTVAQVLGVPLGPTQATQQLGRVLNAMGRTLLVLDNLEQVAASASAVVSTWLRSTHDLRVLQTSRLRLEIPGEQVLEVGPLERGEGEVHPGVQLFEARARSARSGFELSPQERRDTARIVSELEGIPLAIELVAARAAVMRPSEILLRMEKAGMDPSQPSVSKGGMLGEKRPGGIARHRTMRACMDWSWSLLSPAEQWVLSQVSVFEGGFTLDAAEAVVQVPRDLDSSPVFDLLQRLINHSLIMLRSPPGPDLPGRFLVLDLVRAFAREHLEQREEVEARHALYFAEFGAVRFQAQVRSHGGLARYRALLLEIDNLARATSVSVAAERDDVATRLLAAGNLLVDRGFRWPGWREAVEQVYARTPEEASRRSTLTWMIGLDAMRDADCVRAVALFTEGVGHAEHMGQRAPELLNRIGLSYALRTAREMVRAYAAVQHVPAAAQRLDLWWIEVRAHMAISGLVPGDAEMSKSIEHLEQAIRISRDHGDIRAEITATGNLGVVLEDQGRGEEADAIIEAILPKIQQLGPSRLEAEMASVAGLRSLLKGDVDLAVERLRRADRRIGSLGVRGQQLLVRARLMRALAVQGQTEEVVRIRAEWFADGPPQDVIDGTQYEIWVSLAHVARTLGDPERFRAAMQQVEAILAVDPPFHVTLLSSGDLETLRAAVAQGSVSTSSRP